MAEGGRRHRSGRRRRSALQHVRQQQQQQYDNRASSDSELAQGPAGGAQSGPSAAESPPRQKWFFHEGVDVDQLARYRRRRFQSQPRDHLGIPEDDDGHDHDDEDDDDQQKDQDPTASTSSRHQLDESFPRALADAQRRPSSRLVTEYRLAFRSSCDDIFRCSQENLSPIRPKPRPLEDKSSKETEDITKTDSRASDNTNNANNIDLSMYKTQNDIDFKEMMDVFSKRPAPFRRGTTLRNEGDFFASTEYSNYVPYYGLHRSELRRRGTALRLEGELATSTEKNDQFVEWPTEFLRRPDPVRLPTNLKLEGELQIGTECRDKYVPFVGARRPDILRQQSQLRMDQGHARWTPEYADVFKDFNGVDRPSPKKPETNLKPGGGFYEKTEVRDFFSDPRDKEKELEAEMAKKAEEEERKRLEEEELEKQKEEEEELERNRFKEEEMRMLVSKLEGLKGPPLEVPEYKAAYKDFPRERPKLLKPEDEIGRADGSKIPSPCPASRFRTKIDQDPEYKSIHLDPTKERWLFHRPPIPSLRSSNPPSGRNSLVRLPVEYPPAGRKDSKRSIDIGPTTELRSQFVDYGVRPRQESIRIPPSLRLEGNHEMESEFRNVYGRGSVAASDKQELSVPSRHRERSLSGSRRRDSNPWIDNDNSERFGAVNQAEDQDAFQILQTRVHDDNVFGKPPTGGRRNSRSTLPRTSLASVQSDLQPPGAIVDLGQAPPPPQPSIVRHRSPSPSSYRLQVNNVDDETRGFAPRQRRPSPVCQNLNIHATTDRSPSPIQKSVERPYSPSFGREESAVGPRQPPQPQHAFVVLDNGHVEDAPSRRRRTDRNFNPRDSLSSIRGSNSNLPPRPPRPRTPPGWMPPWYDSSTSTI